ncbi:hypothetical protein BK720_04680 [Bacillus thuringiensis serovar brasilensis]|nr:hypothetical protein BK720_04680 [Bacillus thuringiensis serovar brasilensis]
MNPYFQKKSAFFFFYNPMYLFIHSYPDVDLEFLFVTELAKKLYKILHTFNVFFQNTTISLDFKPSHCFIHCILVYPYIT